MSTFPSLNRIAAIINRFRPPGEAGTPSDLTLPDIRLPARLDRRLGHLIRPPEFSDSDLNRRVLTLYNFIIFSLALINLLAVPIIVSSPAPVVGVLIFLAIDSFSILALFELRAGRLILAGNLFLGIVWASMTATAAYIYGGLVSPALEVYLLIILAAGLFLGIRAALIYSAICWLTVGGLFLAGNLVYLSKPIAPYTPMHALALHTLSYSMGVMLILIVARGFQAALERARYNEDILADKNRQLQEVLTSLEERIADRAGEILRQKQFYEALVEHSPIAIVTLDRDHYILSSNPAFENLFGYTQDECVGRNLDSLITTQPTLEEARAYTCRILDGETIHVTGQRRRKDDRPVDVEISGVPVLVDGVRIGVLAMYHDISERLQAEAHLKHLATHDPLTLLPNRTLFYDHLNHSLQLAHRNHTRLAVLFLDLDGFKTVNDLLGHAKGDLLLQQVAQRLKNALRKSDLVSRLGGDEFAFVLENLRSPHDVARVAEKILEALARPFLVEGQELSISGSVGIALFPEDGDEPRNLLRHADAAMYRVKGQGKQHFQFFSWDGR